MYSEKCKAVAATSLRLKHEASRHRSKGFERSKGNAGRRVIDKAVESFSALPTNKQGSEQEAVLGNNILTRGSKGLLKINRGAGGEGRLRFIPELSR